MLNQYINQSIKNLKFTKLNIKTHNSLNTHNTNTNHK